jgi:acyl-CoA synthetase (NDP forming)
MPGHRLDPLLQPRSIAVVGASARAGSPGNEVLVNLRKGGFEGPVYAVNPARRIIDDIPCHPSLAALPAVPQHVVFAVNDEHLEACFDEALALGVAAATVFSAMSVPGVATPGVATPGASASGADTPGLAQRIGRKARAAGMLLHGGNSMGFFNFRGGVWMSGFDTRSHDHPGNVVLLSQSGAGMSGILDCEERLDFLFAASTGQELCLGVEDYLDYVLDLPQTRVVGLFLETSRQPGRFLAALEKARRRQVPVVVLKVGRTELAARLAVSHSGALAGNDAVFDALFRRYGVQRVGDMAQLAATLMLFAQPHPLGPGGLATLHDSGGERQLALDMADELGLAYPALRPSTVAQLEATLDAGLPAVNPLDAWGNGGTEASARMAACFTALMSDPGIALGAVVHDRAPGGGIYASYLQYLRSAHGATGKPVCLVANCAGSGSDPQAIVATRQGFPVLDGLREFQVAARSVLSYRDFLATPPDARPVATAPAVVAHWREKLRGAATLDEAEAGQLLRDFGIAVVAGTRFEGPSVPPELLRSLRYPVVLKTARAGIAHKSDVGGVLLNLADAAALEDASERLSARLGPRLLVAPMVNAEGVEMILGVARDSQFGPIVVMGLGGVHAQLLRDTVVLLPPFGPGEAMAALQRLRMSGLLAAVRGRQALAVEAFCEMASRLSVLAVELADCVVEIDINPVRLMVGECLGLDALVVANGERQQ